MIIFIANHYEEYTKEKQNNKYVERYNVFWIHKDLKAIVSWRDLDLFLRSSVGVWSTLCSLSLFLK